MSPKITKNDSADVFKNFFWTSDCPSNTNNLCERNNMTILNCFQEIDEHNKSNDV